MLLVRGAEVMLISKLKGRVGIKQIDIQGWDFRQREQQRQIIKEQQSVQKAAGHGEYCVLHFKIQPLKRNHYWQLYRNTGRYFWIKEPVIANIWVILSTE